MMYQYGRHMEDTGNKQMNRGYCKALYNQRNKDETIIMIIKKRLFGVGSEGITEDLPPEERRINVINELNKKFGLIAVCLPFNQNLEKLNVNYITTDCIFKISRYPVAIILTWFIIDILSHRRCLHDYQRRRLTE